MKTMIILTELQKNTNMQHLLLHNKEQIYPNYNGRGHLLIIYYRGVHVTMLSLL